MKTRPIVPARIDFGDVPASVDYGDLYHPRVGAPAQAEHVFLQGNELPARWAARQRFVVLETGFGLGHNFLATWHAWREDAARCARLVYVAIELHPPRLADLRRAHAHTLLPDLAAQLQRAWPPLTPNLHTLDFDDGAVQLLLALGDVAQLLPALRLHADAFYLDGFAPARNPVMWEPRVLAALGRKAADGATLATWSVAREVREGLASAGFEVRRAPGIGGKREITLARWAPRFARRELPTGALAASSAVVVGAGIAGACTARALARAGLHVTVLEQHAQPASEASGNLAGLFHGTVDADDSRYARLYRAAALQAQREYAPAIDGGTVAGDAGGLLRADAAHDIEAMAEVLQRLALPADYVQALDAPAASAAAGVPLRSPAWHYPGGGWIAPAEWVRHALTASRVTYTGGARVARLVRAGDDWLLCAADGSEIARAPLVVLANGAATARLLERWGASRWPLQHTRGQVSGWLGGGHGALRRAVAGDGYAIPLPDGGLLCGATHAAGTPGEAASPAPRAEDDALNLQRLQRLTGMLPPAERSLWHSRAGWRLHAADRMPIAGALPLPELRTGQRSDQARLWPREAGLFVLGALGSRGLTLAPLLARLVAAQATGAPWPLEQDLADAVDPARWRVRAARRGDQPELG